jgi:hypothetical protein
LIGHQLQRGGVDTGNSQFQLEQLLGQIDIKIGLLDNSIVISFQQRFIGRLRRLAVQDFSGHDGGFIFGVSL